MRYIPVASMFFAVLTGMFFAAAILGTSWEAGKVTEIVNETYIGVSR